MRQLHLIANDIRSLENVGAIFRTCDSLGVHKLWLTGYTAAPPDPRIAKVALGADKSVAFEQKTDVLEVINDLQKEGIPVYALELIEGAVDLAKFSAPDRMGLLLGTETTGIPPSLLSACDGAVSIVQKGIKESLNVAVAAGIASWAILR